MPEYLGWWYFPAIALGAWTLLGLSTTVSFAGHSTLMAKLICGVLAAFFAVSMGSPLLLSPTAQRWFTAALAASLAATMMGGTAWAFVAALRRQFIAWPTLVASLAAWLAAVATLALKWPLVPGQPPLAFALIAGALALAVAPLAAAPLALSWNRHR
jgi:hypothetical protein